MVRTGGDETVVDERCDALGAEEGPGRFGGGEVGLAV